MLKNSQRTKHIVWNGRKESKPAKSPNESTSDKQTLNVFVGKLSPEEIKKKMAECIELFKHSKIKAK